MNPEEMPEDDPSEKDEPEPAKEEASPLPRFDPEALGQGVSQKDGEDDAF